MHLLVFHGYLLRGTGTNVYNARLVPALVRAGHTVDLLAQDAQAHELDWVDAVGGLAADDAVTGVEVLHRPRSGRRPARRVRRQAAAQQGRRSARRDVAARARGTARREARRGGLRRLRRAVRRARGGPRSRRPRGTCAASTTCAISPPSSMPRARRPRTSPPRAGWPTASPGRGAWSTSSWPAVVSLHRAGGAEHRPEAFGMVAAEAAAAGVLPIVAAHSGLDEVAATLAPGLPAEARDLLRFAVGPQAVGDIAHRLVTWLAMDRAQQDAVRASLVAAARRAGTSGGRESRPA